MRSDIRVTDVTPYCIDAPARTPLKFAAVVVPSCTCCQVKAHPKVFTRIDEHVSTVSIVGTGLGCQIDRIDRRLD